MRGLKAVEASRVERNKVKRPTVKVIIWFALPMIVGLILYFRWESNQVESARQRLLGKQRAAAVEWGGKWFEVRDHVEEWTVALAAKPDIDVVESAELAGFDFRKLP